MKEMLAKYRGTCAGCRRSITPGDAIAHAGRGATYHIGCKPSVAAGGESASASPYTGGSRPMGQRRGKCIDAPCCGCCD